MEEKSVFELLNSVDVSEKIKEKNELSYLSWSDAWAEVKKRYPDANYHVFPQIMDEFGNSRFWHDDGKSGWVTVSVTINSNELMESLAIMDYKNKSIPADQITSVDANKSLKRCLVKACALHGLGLYIYSGEDVPEDITKLINLQNIVTDIAKKKYVLSDKAKEKALELCCAAEKESNPDMDDELISGKISNINDTQILENLKINLLAIRK